VSQYKIKQFAHRGRNFTLWRKRHYLFIFLTGARCHGHDEAKVMEKRKASSESAEADKQYLGKFR